MRKMMATTVKKARAKKIALKTQKDSNSNQRATRSTESRKE